MAVAIDAFVGLGVRHSARPWLFVAEWCAPLARHSCRTVLTLTTPWCRCIRCGAARTGMTVAVASCRYLHLCEHQQANVLGGRTSRAVPERGGKLSARKQLSHRQPQCVNSCYALEYRVAWVRQSTITPRSQRLKHKRSHGGGHESTCHSPDGRRWAREHRKLPDTVCSPQLVSLPNVLSCAAIQTRREEGGSAGRNAIESECDGLHFVFHPKIDGKVGHLHV